METSGTDWLAQFGSAVADDAQDYSEAEVTDRVNFGIVDYEEVETTPTTPTMGDGSPIEFHCLECGIPLHYGGRGRHPKYCDEHKPGRKTSTTGATTPRTRGTSAKLSKQHEAIRDEFADNIRLVGVLVTPMLPVTGRVIIHDSDTVADSVVKLARNNPKILLALQRASQVGPGVVFARSLVTIGVALAVDTHRIEPDSQIAFLIGVAKYYEEIYGTTHRQVVESTAPPTAAFV